jgi:hypothetical protein
MSDPFTERALRAEVETLDEELARLRRVLAAARAYVAAQGAAADFCTRMAAQRAWKGAQFRNAEAELRSLFEAAKWRLKALRAALGEGEAAEG